MNEINYNELLDVASFAGRMILENGGEVYRVEHTVNHICQCFGAAGSDCYASPTAMMLSIRDSSGGIHTLVTRITKRKNNLSKVDGINEISRKITRDSALSEIKKQMRAVDEEKSFPWWLDLICGGLVAGAFAIMIGDSFRDCLCAFFIGIVIRSVDVFLRSKRINMFFCNIVGGTTAAILSWISTTLGLGTNQDNIIVASIMALVPGLLFANALRDIGTGDLISGLSRLIEAFAIAAAIACGVAIFFGLLELIGGMVI